MKQIKVITEITKENFQNELAKYIANGFKVLQANVTSTPAYYNINNVNKNGDLFCELSEKGKNFINNTIKNNLLYFALLIKED